MQFNPAGPTATTWVDDITTFLVASLVAGGSAVKARASTGRGRSGWTWITAGATSWALGEATWGWYAVVRAEAVPSPGIADVFYLSAVPLVVVGIALLSSNSGQMTTAFRNICDGLIIAGSLLFISWSTALGVVYRSGGGSTLARIVDLAYPATDIVLCTAALSALSRVQRSRRRELGTDGARAPRIRDSRQRLHLLLLHEQLRQRKHLRHGLHRRLPLDIPGNDRARATDADRRSQQGVVDGTDAAPLHTARSCRHG